MLQAIQPNEGKEEVKNPYSLERNFYAALLQKWKTNTSLKKEDGTNFLDVLIAEIDEVLNEQINLILHHPTFQKLEASWRGLHFLTEQPERAWNLKIRLLNISWNEIKKDLSKAIEFDQSQIFKKIYEGEIDQPGGEPFGLIVGDYYLNYSLGARGSFNDDVETLKNLTQVSAAAFSPLVTSIDASFFGLDCFEELYNLSLYKEFLTSADNRLWSDFRKDEDSRFLGLIIPSILGRKPYETYINQFYFTEDTSCQEKHLWSNGAYAFAAVIMQAFRRTGWFLDVFGTPDSGEGGGIVKNLPEVYFSTDKRSLFFKYPLNALITPRLDREFREHGFVALCHSQYTDTVAFHNCTSVQEAKVYDRKPAQLNANLSVQLHHMLCVSRFAHFIKIMMRDKVGSFSSAQECESFIRSWLSQYISASDEIGTETLTNFPLRDAQVKVREKEGAPGNFLAILWLSPHCEYSKGEILLDLTMEFKKK